MRPDESPDEAAERLQADNDANQPFRSSGAGETYEPAGNWGTERRPDHPDGSTDNGGTTRHGMEGAPSGAGYGGFGPEGGYSGAAGDQNADIAGQVNAEPDPLVKQAQREGPVRPDRR